MGGTASRLFAQEGAQVVIGDVLDAKGQEMVSEIQAKGGKALFVKTDVSKESDCQKLVAEAVRAFLLAHFRLSHDNLVAKGYGESQPETEERNQEEMLRNRRVILRVMNPDALPKNWKVLEDKR